MIKDDKIPYQYGDPRDGDYLVFRQSGLAMSYSVDKKTQLASSPLFSGDARLNGFEEDLIGDLRITVKFQITKDDKYSQSYINKLFNAHPRKMFWWVVDNTSSSKLVKRILFNYVSCVSLPTFATGIDEQGNEFRSYTVSLRLLTPEFYEPETDELGYYTAGATRYFLDGSWVLDGSIVLDTYENNTFPLFSTLNIEQQRALLFPDSLEPLRPLSYQDRFFQSQNFGVGTYSIIDTTLTNNDELLLTSNGLQLETSQFNRVYLIRFDSLLQDESITVGNVTTDSDITITWLHSVAHGSDLLYNSTTGLVYDALTGNEINILYYSVDTTRANLLYFSKYEGYELNEYLEVRNNLDSLTLQKNTSSNNQIVIQTLKTYI